MKIIDAKEINQNVLVSAKEFFNDVETTVVILNASDDEASEVYVDKKQKAFEKIGVNCVVYDLDEYTTTDDMIEEIMTLNEDSNVCGIMVQYPVYPHIDFAEVILTIDPVKDIDGLTQINQGMKNYRKASGTYPATTRGVIDLLSHNEVDLSGKLVTIVGKGFLVADPLAKYMEHCGATVVKIHTRTPYTTKCVLLGCSDIIVSCAGVDLSDLLNPRICKSVEVLIGVGFRYENGKQIQDFKLEDWEDTDVLVTNRINGTGLATITGLLENTAFCYMIQGGM